MNKFSLSMLCIAFGGIAYALAKMGCGNQSCCESQVLRTADHKINRLFLKRRSGYVLSGEPIRKKELESLFEAARWAPSSYNSQPARFIYALRDTPEWNTFMDLLVDFNKGWAQNAGALVVIVSKNTFDHNNEFSPTHSFDAGAAWQNLALEAADQGLIAHGMGGFDYAKAKQVLQIPDGYTVEAMVAIGKPGDAQAASEHLQELEKRALNAQRKPIEEIAFEGTFKK